MSINSEHYHTSNLRINDPPKHDAYPIPDYEWKHIRTKICKQRENDDYKSQLGFALIGVGLTLLITAFTVSAQLFYLYLVLGFTLIIFSSILISISVTKEQNQNEDFKNICSELRRIESGFISENYEIDDISSHNDTKIQIHTISGTVQIEDFKDKIISNINNNGENSILYQNIKF